MARPSLQNNVKFKALVRRLNLPRPYVRGLLDTMWDVANESGNPVLGDPSDVESAAEWPGTPGELFAALNDQKLIEQDESSRWIIHDYWDHAPKYVKNRAYMEAKRKGSYRPKNDWKADSSTNNDLRSDCGPQWPTVAQCPPTPAPAPIKTPKGVLSPTGDVPTCGADSAMLQAAQPAATADAGKAGGTGRKRKQKPTGEERPEHAELRNHFRELWKARNGADYAWKYGRDDAHAKWVLDACGRDIAQAKRIVEAFIGDDDAWVSERGHEISLLVSRFNRYRAKPLAEEGNGFARTPLPPDVADTLILEAHRAATGR